MRQFNLTITCDTFGDNPAPILAVLLHAVAEKVTGGVTGSGVFDATGAQVGSFCLSRDDRPSGRSELAVLLNAIEDLMTQRADVRLAQDAMV